MYLDPRFKPLLILIEQQKRAVQNAVKVELTTTMLHEREKNQESEEAEQTASPTIHSEQLEHPGLSPNVPSWKNFLIVLSDQEQEKMVVLQELLRQNYKSMNLRSHLV